MSFCIGNCKISVSPLFVSFICLILLIDTTGLMLFGFISVFIHESGHLTMMILAKKPPAFIKFRLGGIIIESRGFSGYNKEFLIASGGCLFNFSVFVFAFLYYFNTKSEMALLFSASNFGLFAFNLVPIDGLDGMDLIRFSLIKKFSPDKTEKICKIISIVFILLGSLITTFFVITNRLNPTILICFIYLIILALIGIKQK